ncbi:hypothetical protein B7494_g2257 [Chlorociboria aeruginascens]|nr:hypothetical protein B7494_g2257 [Chlorociboria aeruginascens]
MDSNGEDGASVRDADLEERLPQGQSGDLKPTYKSFKYHNLRLKLRNPPPTATRTTREPSKMASANLNPCRKKYRKMRIKFDEKMHLSNEYYIQEQMAQDTAKRLAQENDQLLDLLLDVNNSAQIPADRRIDLTLEPPSINAVPPLVSAEELARAAQYNTPAGQAIYEEICAMMKEKALAEQARGRASKSISLLMQTPHLTSSDPNVSPDLITALTVTESGQLPVSYMTLDHMDDYLSEIDIALGTTPLPASHAQTTSPNDLALQNPHSVYNWLRLHEPKIFLQDGEGSEKSLGKPGALRGAGKRASIPAPSRPDALEFVEEDGIGYDTTLGGTGTATASAKGKRKREDDDGGYHPKTGRVDDPKPKKRAYKKRGSGEASASSAKKSKSKKSPPNPPPEPRAGAAGAGAV